MNIVNMRENMWGGGCECQTKTLKLMSFAGGGANAKLYILHTHGHNIFFVIVVCARESQKNRTQLSRGLRSVALFASRRADGMRGLRSAGGLDFSSR